MNTKIINKIDIFNPLILVVIITLFVLLALPSWYITEELHTPEIPMYYFILIGIVIFILATFITGFLFKKTKKFKKLKTFKLKKADPLPNFGGYTKEEKIILGIVIIGILLQIINLIHLGGIPLFSSALKSRAATKIWLLSYLLYLPGINILLVKYNRKTNYVLLFLGLFLFALTGYRTTPIAILLSSFISLYYTRNFKTKHYLIFGVLLLFILVIVGFIAMKSIVGQQWRLGPLELISYRAAFTLNIFDKITRREFLTGGQLFYYTLTGFFNSVDPRVIVGKTVLLENHSLTSTIFGPVTLDFGLIGMSIQMFILGVILKLMHILQTYKKGILTALYAIILSQTIIWVETGPTDIIVWIFFLISIIAMIYTLINIKQRNKIV